MPSSQPNPKDAQPPTERPLYNPFDPAFQADPHPFLHRLRREDPVHFCRPLRVWVLTRYDDVNALLHHDDVSASAEHWEHYAQFFYRDQLGTQSALADVYRKWMLQLDPPDHTRLRALVMRAFAPRMIEKLRHTVQGIVGNLLDAVSDKREMDYVRDFAHPLPIEVISQMLGLPERDHHLIGEISMALLPSLSPGLSLDATRRAQDAIVVYQEYFRALIRERCNNLRDDLLSELIAAREQGDRLSEDELVSTCILLTFAGHMSTVQLLANLMIALIRHPAQMQAVRSDPSLMRGAVEESLRYESPLQLVYRTTLKPVKIGGSHIDAGQMIFASLPAADRDPDVFENPDTFDIRRTPNRHLAFGHGIHFCAGAALARMEAEVATTAVLRRFKSLDVIAHGIKRESSLPLRGLTAAPMRFTMG